MDKLTFYENLEPFDETREAAQLLGELASLKELKKEIVIMPPEIEKPKVSTVEQPVPIIEQQISEEEEEIVSAKVEEITPSEYVSQLPEPVEPYIPDEEIERMAAMDLQPEMPVFSTETEPIEEKAQNNIPILIHTLESQQEYAREITKTEEPVKKQSTLEDYYFNEDQEPAIFEDKMVVEHTQPKHDAAQYLKDENSTETKLPSPELKDEEKTETLTTNKQNEGSEKNLIESFSGTFDFTDDKITSESEKIVLDIPAETPSAVSEEFYTIDQTAMPESETTSSQYTMDDEIRMGTLPPVEKDDVEISFKDTDSFKIESLKDKIEPSNEKNEESASAYTEITLQGEIPDISSESRQPLKHQFETSQKKEEAAKSSSKDIELSDKDFDQKHEDSEYLVQEIKEKALQEKLASFLPDKEKLSSETGAKIQEEEDGKTPALSFDIEKHALELEKLLSSKAHFPEATKSPEFAEQEDSLKPLSSIEPKELEISKQDEEYRAIVLPFEDIKVKTPIKTTDESKTPELPPFDFPTEREPLKKQKPSYKKKKDSAKEKAELENYESVLAEAQKEAEEFIKDKIKNKEKQSIQVSDSAEESIKDQEKSSESQSFSDFLTKVKLQQPEKPEEIEDADRSFRPALEKSHVPDDIADKLPIVQQEVFPRGPVDLSVDLSVKPPSSEITDLKYDSVPLNSDEKEELVKEPKLKSFISKLLKKKDKEDKIE